MVSNSKKILAKLLAQENITVVQENSNQSSFDTRSRVLTIPMWQDMNNDTYNHLVGHEVGSALYKDNQQWSEINQRAQEFVGKSDFINVVEDARTDKLVCRRYPGIRKNFIKSNNDFFQRGFFGTTNRAEINDLPLIDRINTHFKCGESFGVQFSEDEQEYVNRVASAETLKDVEQIATEIYQREIELQRQQQEQEQNDAEDDQDESEDETQDEGEQCEDGQESDDQGEDEDETESADGNEDGDKRDGDEDGDGESSEDDQDDDSEAQGESESDSGDESDEGEESEGGSGDSENDEQGEGEQDDSEGGSDQDDGDTDSDENADTDGDGDEQGDSQDEGDTSDQDGDEGDATDSGDEQGDSDEDGDEGDTADSGDDQGDSGDDQGDSDEGEDGESQDGDSQDGEADSDECEDGESGDNEGESTNDSGLEGSDDRDTESDSEGDTSDQDGDASESGDEGESTDEGDSGDPEINSEGTDGAVEDENGDESVSEKNDSGDDLAVSENGEAGDSAVDTNRQAGNDENFKFTPPVSKTAQSMEQNLDDLRVDDDVEINNIVFHEGNEWKDHIVNHKYILEQMDDRQIALGLRIFKNFQKDNKKTISYLCKEFEMKKRAAEYARTSTSKTGVIDPVLMNNYKFSENIFKRVEITPEGKNHGLMVVIDWSGSMYDDLSKALDQLINMVLFCRQVQIPFRVYAFSNHGVSEVVGRDSDGDEILKNVPVDYNYQVGHIYPDNMHLLEFFNSDSMKNRQINNMLGALCWVKFFYEIRNRRSGTAPAYQEIYQEILDQHGTSRYAHEDEKEEFNIRTNKMPRILRLTGTPLDSALVILPQVFQDFKEKNRLDIGNIVIITDGMSCGAGYAQINENKESKDYGKLFINSLGSPIHKAKARAVWDKKPTYLNIVDKVSKITYEMDLHNLDGREETNLLIQRIKDRTGCNVIGFFICATDKHQFSYNLFEYWNETDEEDFKRLHREFKTNSYIAIPNTSYDKYFGVANGDALATSNGALQVSENANKEQVLNAFKKMSNSRKSTRKMLSEFIELVA